MAKELSPSVSTSKSYSQSETTAISLSPYTTSNATKAEIYLVMRCGTSHYSQRSMDEMPDLHMIFADSRIVGNITLGRTNLPNQRESIDWVIVYGTW